MGYLAPNKTQPQTEIEPYALLIEDQCPLSCRGSTHVTHNSGEPDRSNYSPQNSVALAGSKLPKEPLPITSLNGETNLI